MFVHSFQVNRAFRAFTGAPYQCHICSIPVWRLHILIIPPQLFHKRTHLLYCRFGYNHSASPLFIERTHKAKGIQNRIGLMKVNTSINNMNNAFTSAVNVDVEVTVLRFCSKFVGFGIKTNFELYKKEKGCSLSKSPNPTHILK